MDGSASGCSPMTVLESIRRHWLLAINVLVGIFVSLPLVAPALMAAGLTDAANSIYAAYHLVCHQWAFRSYFLFGAQPEYGHDLLAGLVGASATYGFVGSPELGYKVAFCQRDVAIYLAVLAGGLAYARWRERIPTLGIVGYGLLILPMALDGLTQVVGWRESTVELRTLTGALFGLASVWLIYPRIDAVFERDLGPAQAAPVSSAWPA